MPSFYEFFAGGGMAMAGLRESGNWECLFANDIDKKKADSYKANWLKGLDWEAHEPNELTAESGLPADADQSDGARVGHLLVCDVAKVTTKDLKGHADLVWASFPCQDLSLAGNGAGLSGDRSGTFLPFWKLVKSLRDEKRPPKLVVLENVVGALTAGKGQDFVTLGDMLATTDYRFGAVVINAVHWVPQSRPRLFIIAAHKDVAIREDLVSDTWSAPWHTPALVTAYERLMKGSKATNKHDAWLWWRLPAPPAVREPYETLADLIQPDDELEGVPWHPQEETDRLWGDELMNAVNQEKVRQARKRSVEEEVRVVGTVYKRMRPEGEVIGYDDKGKPIRKKVQRAEVRFDDIAGCLRTPTGGSSRQTILVIDGERVRSRLLSPREAARLMGLAKNYELPDKYNDAYHLAGDGVVVDVVRFIAQNILNPLLENASVADKLSA
ncbi:DNA (cytosine-5)-methyltransferase 1 [Nocardia amikacinitolerans]|uniref:DNA cytosine methyltransferase n=1 Tax=Nocardia amikacinitolerans TaxID=756689 RepID=UPI0020A5B376|nr:DNA (cytosine-5-)-methyltransferase [Nocardia amikacinitolerans]MCP2298328.1 DNA (cytosine-5)-methyltransferase 1 [Nocardia amikacinitolerans]